MRGATMLLAVVVVLTAVPACTDYEAGEEAGKRGDYATELKKLRPLAEQGNATAQVNLGTMYAMGFGVPQDDKEAVRWYGLAATQGYAPAQQAVGMLYATGLGAPQDDVLAHLWLNLAAVRGLEPARTLRDRLAEKMTPAQLDEAQRLAREWKLKSK